MEASTTTTNVPLKQCNEDLSIDLTAICENLIGSFIYTVFLLFIKFLFWIFQPHFQRFKFHIFAFFETGLIEIDREAAINSIKANDEENLHSLISKFDAMEKKHEKALHEIDECLRNRVAGLEQCLLKNIKRNNNNYVLPSSPPIIIPESSQIVLVKKRKAKRSKRHSII